MTRFRYFRVTYKPEKRMINVAEVSKKHKIAAVANIPITKKECVDMRIYVTREGKQDFTMQYRNNVKGIRIRCDNAHSRIHIDKELPGEPQKKRWLEKIPKDYDEAIDLILSSAEEYNPRIGAMYWITPPLLSNKDKRVEELEKMKIDYRIKTPLTVLAKVVHHDVINFTHKKKQLSLNQNEMIKLFDTRCREIANLESKANGPLKVQIAYSKDITLFPFTIICPPTAHVDYEDYPFTGKVTKNDLVGFECEL